MYILLALIVRTDLVPFAGSSGKCAWIWKNQYFNAIEHVFMYKLIKITELIFTTPISLQWKGALLWFLWSKPFHLI